MTGLVVAFIVLAVVIFVVRARSKRAREATAMREALRVTLIDDAEQEAKSPSMTSSLVRPEAVWVPPGVTTQVAGRQIPGGMVFVGTGLRALNRMGVEPALIDPKLRVSFGPGAVSGAGLNYWPSYSTISPDHRAAYLGWLAAGRAAPGEYIGYVFLFFYGLERRVLDPSFPCPQEELAVITDEVERLLETYSGNGSFQGYAGQFLEDVLLPRLPGRSPRAAASGSSGGTISPRDVRRELQECATGSLPIPAELVYQWAVANPSTRLGTAAQRCRADFHRLLVARYSERFGEGLKVRGRAGNPITQYRPASAGFAGPVEIRLDPERVPRIVPDDIPARLQGLVDECVADLDAYSRWIGRHPGLERTAASLALLPPELIDSDRRALVTDLIAAIEGGLATETFGSVPGATLLSHWPLNGESSVGKADYVGMAQLLEKLGYGMEPDIRFGGGRFEANEAVVVYRLPKDVMSAPTAELNAATLLLHLTALVAVADGSVSQDEEAHLIDHLERAMKLSESERLRLQARFTWLVRSAPGFAGIKRRVEALGEAQREAIGEFLVGVAGADGKLAAAEVETLERVYRRIGLESGSLYSHIHALSTGADDDDAPTTILKADMRPSGHRIPAPRAGAGGRKEGVALNTALVEKKLQQSAAVAALLGSVFASEDAPLVPQRGQTPEAPQSAPALVPGLDGSHSELLRRVAERGAWPRAEFDSLANSLGILPDGALDSLNSAAYELTGGPVLEDGDPVTVELAVVAEMTK